VRRHAKASTAGSTRQQATVALAALLALSAVLLSATPAFAATVTDRPLLFSFDATDTPAGHFVKPSKIAIDNSTGYVYVAEGNQPPGDAWTLNEAISKFNPDGTAADFSALGSPTIFGAPPFFNLPGVAVDNSGGPNQGRLYVSTKSFGVGGTNRLIAYSPSGEILWQIDPGIPPTDVAVDSTGHPYLGFASQIRKYANTGSPTHIASFPIGVEQGGFDIDASGNIYVANFGGVKKYVGGAFDSTLNPASSFDVYVDQSSATGHVFTANSATENFDEYDSSGALVGTFGAGIGEIAGSEGSGIGYSKSLDRVYVSDHGPEAVDAFGPAATGTVPDPTIEATTGIGVAIATLHGTVNPQSVANAYYFEWSRSQFGKFAESSRSPLQSLPEDGSPHAVSYEPNNLFGDSTYRVRVVALNTANGLRQVSGISEFKTLKAAASPVVTINAPGSIATTTAHITGTINPQEDSVLWGVLVSTDSACNSGFTGSPTRKLAGGGINTPVSVEADLKNLLPAQHYCVRIVAINSFGEVTSETKEFSTVAIPPSEVVTAFAAPRTDTTARINGLVNPEGEADFEYHFELSPDGTNWTTLPNRESTLDARMQIIVDEELTGLEPDTTYHYRLASAENDAGPAASTGVVKTFTTRKTAELEIKTPNAFGEAKRGIELVNTPDKGNQNVFAAGPILGTTPISPSGEEVLWTLFAGAPGAPNGAQAAFMAERSTTGWHSQSLAPPAAQQLGGGEFSYRLMALTPDFQTSIFSAALSNGAAAPEAPTLLRIRRSQEQELLKEYEEGPINGSYFENVDVTDDGAHVLFADLDTGQLEDIGSGSPEVVSLMPDETPTSCGFGFQEVDGFLGNHKWLPGYHMIATTDASRVYFELPPNGNCSGPRGLYVRNRDSEETTLIDQGTAGQPTEIIRATPDGRHAYFTTFNDLDPNDENIHADVYRWDEEAGESSCLTCVVADANVTGSFTLVSDDFSHIYFESKERLVPGLGTQGNINLYVLSDGAVRFIATPDTAALGRQGRSELSANGNVLVMAVEAELTADALAPKCIEPLSGNLFECHQLYRYDDRDGSLECLSCRHGAVTGHSNGATGVGTTFDFRVSGDGDTVAFATSETLLPLDVNRDSDLYEWRNGALRLITDGVSDAKFGLGAAGVAAIDSDGSDVFFLLVPQGRDLTGFEHDKLLNLYDARIGGGFEPPAAPVHCVEDSCQGPLQAAPNLDHSASATFDGRGNAAPVVRKRRPCARKQGKAKRRCVRKHKRHSRRARGNHSVGRAK
jgi:hypothetical protein